MADPLPPRPTSSAATGRLAEVANHSGRSVERSQVRHEKTDIRFGLIATVIALLALVLLLAAYGAYRDLAWQKRRYRSPEPSLQGTALPAQPRLEQLEPQSLERASSFRAQEEARLRRLQQYGSAKEENYLHIPIEKAMEHLAKAEREKSESSDQAGSKSRTVVGSGDANSGRLLREEMP